MIVLNQINKKIDKTCLIESNEYPIILTKYIELLTGIAVT